MQHSFDISIAEKFGVDEAVFLNNMAFWVQKNQANQKHFHNGRYWTYNSQEAFTELFPYWSRQNIRTIIKSCIEKELIITGNFNKDSCSHTSWYALTDLGLSLFSCFNKILNEAEKTSQPALQSIGWNQPIDWLESTNRRVRTNQSIKETDINTDKEKERGKKRLSTRTPVPISFIPNENHELLASQRNLNLQKEISAFIDYYKAHGKIMADWNATFSNWLRKAEGFNKKPYRDEEVPRSAVNRMPFFVSEKNIIRKQI